MDRKHRKHRVVLAILALSVAACTGTPTDVSPDDKPGDPNNPNNPNNPQPGVFAPADARLRRLLSWQYQNAVADLLGPEASAVVEPPADVPLNGFVSVGAASLSLTPTDIEKVERSAFAAAQAALSGSDQSFRVCTPTSFDDAACAEQIVTSLGRRIYRRPLSDDERVRWTNVFTSSASAYGDFDLGLEFAIAGMLQSPHFLYMVEVGTPIDGDDSRRALTGFEVASRLSFFFLGTTPSSALLDAAERGDLDTREGVRLWATQMLGEDRARQALRNFFDEKLGLAQLARIDRPATGLDAGLRDAMREEALRLVDDVIWDRNADAREIFSGRFTYVNDALAGYYGLPLPGQGEQLVRVELGESTRRAGILTTGAFLARYAHETRSSPTLRGKFIRENVMCQAVPAPPDDVNTTLPEPTEQDVPETTRDRIERHMGLERCAGCHSMMDPLGFALEEFDQGGRFRTHERGLPIDARTDVDGIPVDGAAELGAALAEKSEVPYCLVRNIFRHATGHLEEPNEDASLLLVDAAFENAGYRLRDVLVEIAVSDAFLLVKKPEGAQ